MNDILAILPEVYVKDETLTCVLFRFPLVPLVERHVSSQVSIFLVHKFDLLFHLK